jgi:hypothetical protein
MVVVAAPVFQFFPSIGEMEKDFPIQTFVPQPAVETLDVAVLNWVSGPDEVELHTSIVGPGVHSLAGEFAAVVGRDRLGDAPRCHQMLHSLDNFFARL